MKRTGAYKIVLFFMLAVMSVFTGCKKEGKREMPPMYPQYMYRDKAPMGTNIAYRLLPRLFSADVTLASKKMKLLVNEFAYMSGTAYISIGKNIELDSAGLGQLMYYVERGNEFFMSANNFDFRLLDTLGLKHSENYLPSADGRIHRINTAVKMADSTAFDNKKYGFFYYPSRDIFTSYDKSTTKVLGLNDSGQINYVVVRYGKGKFYFHTNPSAFSNYFLLTGNNTEYFSKVFSYLNEDASAVYWADTDRFGKGNGDFSALAIFWKNPPLKYAMLLFLLLILLYIAFESKRKRRLVPQAVPNNNDSISFVQTIGNLYLQKKDNRNIAIKMMTYFLEHIRSNYYLSTNNINAEFVQALSRKSGVEEAKVQTLMDKVTYINEAESLTDQELFEINNLIYEFYKR